MSFKKDPQRYWFLAMLEHVRQIIQKFQLIIAGQTLIVGVSGGTDSVALLHILYTLAPRLGFRLHAAILDHQLRGDESVDDVRFVEQLCRKLDVSLTTGQADVSRLAREQQLGIEAAARLARYDFLADVAKTLGASSVAVAHHADDQAETVLLHLLRGAGIHGLAGMALVSSVPGHADLTLIRPLLRVSRTEIEAYCQKNDLVACYDSTNADTTLLRNAIRLLVLPYLAQYSSHVKPALARFAEIAAVEDDYVQQHVLLFTKSAAVTVSSQQISVDREAFRGLHPALQRRVVLWMAAQLGQIVDTSANLIMDAIEIAMHGRHGAIALLGGKFRLRIEYNFLLVETEHRTEIEQRIPLLPPKSELPIEIPSTTSLVGWFLQATVTEPEVGISFCSLVIPSGSQVVLRTRHVGDIFSPLGMKGHTQKLSRWMVNRKIPQNRRDQIPLLVVDNLIAAINLNGDWVISETFAVRNTSDRIIYFQFLENS
jgi:tRNA(Ile)-lysidine synthase